MSCSVGANWAFRVMPYLAAYHDPHPEATVDIVFRMMRISKSIDAFWR